MQSWPLKTNNDFLYCLFSFMNYFSLSSSSSSSSIPKINSLLQKGFIKHFSVPLTAFEGEWQPTVRGVVPCSINSRCLINNRSTDFYFLTCPQIFSKKKEREKVGLTKRNWMNLFRFSGGRWRNKERKKGKASVGEGQWEEDKSELPLVESQRLYMYHLN